MLSDASDLVKDRSRSRSLRRSGTRSEGASAAARRMQISTLRSMSQPSVTGSIAPLMPWMAQFQRTAVVENERRSMWTVDGEVCEQRVALF